MHIHIEIKSSTSKSQQNVIKMLYNFKLIITKICNTRLTTSSRCFERLISTGEFRVPAVNPEDAGKGIFAPKKPYYK